MHLDMGDEASLSNPKGTSHIRLEKSRKSKRCRLMSKCDFSKLNIY